MMCWWRALRTGGIHDTSGNLLGQLVDRTHPERQRFLAVLASNSPMVSTTLSSPAVATDPACASNFQAGATAHLVTTGSGGGCKECRVQTTGGAAQDDEATEAGALAVAPMQGPPQKRQKTVLTVSASLVPGDAGGAAASREYRAIATAVTKSKLCFAAPAAPLLAGVSEQQRAAETPVQPKALFFCRSQGPQKLGPPRGACLL